MRREADALGKLRLPGAPTVDQLAEVGVKRVSLGTGLAQVAFSLAQTAARELFENGTYTTLDGTIDYLTNERQALLTTPRLLRRKAQSCGRVALAITPPEGPQMRSAADSVRGAIATAPASPDAESARLPTDPLGGSVGSRSPSNPAWFEVSVKPGLAQ